MDHGHGTAGDPAATTPSSMTPSESSAPTPATTSTLSVDKHVALQKDAETPLDTPLDSPRAEPVLQDQSTRMPLGKILIVYFGIGVPLIVSFMDQTSVTTASPQIGSALGGSASVSWIGTGFFVSNCALQLLYGRLSDIFGRKTMLQVAVFFMLLGDLLCSFAKTPIQLYAFRAIAGMGGGGINNIAMVVVSDIVPLKERGKYQGLVSAACSVGNAIGPFVGGALATSGQWRWIFRVTAILSALAIGIAHFVLPLKKVTGSIKQQLAQVDYLGIFLSAAGTILLLVAVSGGGSTFAWDSAVVIVLIIVGVLCGVAFVYVEWKVARLPILPLHLFRDRTAAVVMAQSFFLGMAYYGNMYQVPLFLQYVKGYSALTSGALVLAYLMPQALWGIVSGFFVSKTNHYKIVIIVGGILWTLELGLQILWTQDTSLGVILGVLQLNGCGIGFSLQTTLVAALATTRNQDRAVVTAGRNFFRTMGAAFGLAMADAVYQSVVKTKLGAISALDASQRATLLSSSLSDLDLPAATARAVRDAYAGGLRMVFVGFTAIGVVYVVLSFAVKEITFRRDSPELEAERRRARGGGSGDKEAAVEPRDEPEAAAPSLDDRELGREEEKATV